jgi:Nuclease-related domain
MNPSGLDLRWIGIGAGAIALLGGLYLLVGLYRRRSRRKALLAQIGRIAYDAVHQVLVPDGMGGFFHLDHLLLTPRGLVILDTRRVPGVIFGGDQMSEWTVMGRKHRFTFDNPQPALYDRVAAVKAIVGDAPVEGRVVFSNVGKFTKGMPKWVLMLDALEVQFPHIERSRFDAPESQPLKEGWRRVKAVLQPSPHMVTRL